MVGESPSWAIVNSAPSLPYTMVPAVVFHTLSAAAFLVKSKVALRMPRAVSLGQSVRFKGLQVVQVCAVAGAAIAKRKDRYIRNDMLFVNERLLPFGW